MKTTMTFPMLLVLFLPNTFAQEYTQWDLPEGAIACLGKGRPTEILYSPDGTRLAVASTIGVWLYGTTTYREVALLPVALGWIPSVAFSPDGATLATNGSLDSAVRLWDSKRVNRRERSPGI